MKGRNTRCATDGIALRVEGEGQGLRLLFLGFGKMGNEIGRWSKEIEE